MHILATAAAETPKGWGGQLGILAGLVGIYLVWRIDLWWRQHHGEGADHSPTEPAPLPAPETRRSVASRLTSHDETPPRKTDVNEWWGGISYEPDGTGRRVYKRPAAYGEEPFGDELDLALEIVSDNDAEVPDDEPVDEPAVAEVPVQETASEYAARCLGLGHEKAAVVKALREHYGLSRAQAYRVAGAAERPAGRRAA